MSFNDFKIPRKSGIMRRLMADNPGINPSQEWIDRAIRSEYANYLEVCFRCSEQPMSIEEWGDQTIKPTEDY
jgi:hypothetical protein